MKAELKRIEIDVGELIESRSARTNREADFSAFEVDPTGFIEGPLGASLWDGQRQIAEAVRDRPLTVVRSCNGAGKDYVAARIALWWVFARKGLVLFSGPTDRQVRVICMGEVRTAFHRGRDLYGDLFSMALRIDGAEERRGILAFTSNEAGKITGFHAPRVLAIVTEGQAVEDYAYEALLACATGPEDRLLVLGNPTSPSGKFFEVSRSPSWHAIRLSAEDHPNVQTGEVVIPGAVSRTFVSRIASEYGKDSGVYRSRVLGEFPDQGEEDLFSRAWIDRAFDLFEEGRFAADPRKPPIVLGLDPARLGPDRSALAIRRGRTVLGFELWDGLDTMESAERVERTVRRLVDEVARVEAVYVDEIGLGAGILDRLKMTLPYVRWQFVDDRDVARPTIRDGAVEARAHNAGSRALKPSRFSNLRAQGYWKLRRLLEAGEIALPRNEALAEELLATAAKFTPDGRTAIAPKDEIKARLGRSPDLADSLVISLTPDLASDKKRIRFA